MRKPYYRVQWEVAPYAMLGGLLGWKVTVRRAPKPAKAEVVAVFPVKLHAIAEATSYARYEAEHMGRPGELLIKNRWGRISKDKRSYLYDPPTRG
jgi:hypothetical protein